MTAAMNAQTHLPARKNIDRDLKDVLTTLRQGFQKNPAPTRSERIDRLSRLQTGLLAFQNRLITAVDADFNGRAKAETLMIELLPILEGIRYNKKHLRRWMKPSKYLPYQYGSYHQICARYPVL